MDLTHKDLVKLGLHEAKQGYSLQKIEADFLDKGISKRDALRALDEVDAHIKQDALKAQREEEAKKLEAEKTASGKTESGNKLSFWSYFLVFLMLVGLALFYYYYNNKF